MLSKKKNQKSLLTPREKEVIAYFAKGYVRKMIADALRISIETVNTYFKSIYAKLQINSQAELTHLLVIKSPRLD